jgi:hypothetical protein
MLLSLFKRRCFRFNHAALAAAAISTISLGMLMTPKIAHAGGYGFTRIADNQGPFHLFEPRFSMNEGGQVAFYALLDTQLEGIYVGDGTTLTTIVEEGGPVGIAGQPCINNLGNVAFPGWTNTGLKTIHLAQKNGALVALYDSSGAFDAFGSQVSLNDSNTVAFTARLDSGMIGVFTGNGQTGSLKTIDTTTTAGYFSPPRINATGVVAYGKATPSSSIGIYVSNAGAITSIAQPTGPFAAVYGSSLESHGFVAFTADLMAGGHGIYVRRASSPTITIANTTGIFSQFDGISINSVGEVAFAPKLDNGHDAVYVYRNGQHIKVIEEGEPLFGSVVSTIQTHTTQMNNKGQVAFMYWLTDGRHGIARATPMLSKVRSPLFDQTYPDWRHLFPWATRCGAKA